MTDCERALALLRALDNSSADWALGLVPNSVYASDWDVVNLWEAEEEWDWVDLRIASGATPLAAVIAAAKELGQEDLLEEKINADQP